jgi:hypothetical protein
MISMRLVALCGLSVASLLLAACASTQAVLAKEPSETWQSDKSPREVAFCLANKNNVSALERDDGSRVVLIKNGYGGVAIALTVKPDGTGSKTEVRHQFGIVGAIWKQCIGTKVALVGSMSLRT